MLAKYWKTAALGLLILLGALYLLQIVQQRDSQEQRRIELLEKALAPQTAENAANDWAEAVKTRNGAWQYALMDEQLRQEYRKEFEDQNWVTGFSSPWVEDYQISREDGDETDNVTFQVKFNWYTSDGYLYSNTATLIVSSFDAGAGQEIWLLTYLDFSYEPDE